jgi:hypothetical protein
MGGSLSESKNISDQNKQKDQIVSDFYETAKLEKNNYKSYAKELNALKDQYIKLGGTNDELEWKAINLKILEFV